MKGWLQGRKNARGGDSFSSMPGRREWAGVADCSPAGHQELSGVESDAAGGHASV